MNLAEWKKEYGTEKDMVGIIENAAWRAYLFHRDSSEGEGAEQANVYLDLFHLLNDNRYKIEFE